MLDRIECELQVGQIITLDGTDPNDGILDCPEILIWSDFHNRLKDGISGGLDHGEKVQYLGETDDKEGVHIKSGNVEGWVSWFFIKELKYGR